jgi:hypothetical protein
VLEIELKAGDIFIWNKYPIYFNEFKDRRWFLFLGYQTLEAIVYQVTTTTQLQRYTTDGNRTGNNFFKIRAGIGGLITDSIVDLTTYFERVPEYLFNQSKSDIEKQGNLNQEHINILIKHLKKDSGIPPIIKKDIYRYLKEAHFIVNV